jgi:hypothetical protein
MKFRWIMLGATTMLTSGIAHAGPLYDTVNVNAAAFNQPTDWTWIDPSSEGPAAASFTATSSTNLSSVSLELSAETPSDGGSLVVVLMPDNSGLPPFTSVSQVGNPNFKPNFVLASFTNDTVLGTIADSQLSATASPSLLNVQTNAALTAGQRYWIGLFTQPLAGSLPAAGRFGSGQWWFTAANPTGSVGATGQFDFNSDGLNSGTGAFEALPNGALEMIVNTSEPASLAILGAGLAGLGYFRRRADRT